MFRVSLFLPLTSVVVGNMDRSSALFLAVGKSLYSVRPAAAACGPLAVGGVGGSDCPDATTSNTAVGRKCTTVAAVAAALDCLV